MPKFRKKPVAIEAMQLPAEGEDASNELIDWLHADAGSREFESSYNGALLIHTLEGTMEASPGDWIIKGIKGELYPCKPDIFEATYEPVEDPD
jgi:hypothetical protein